MHFGWLEIVIVLVLVLLLFGVGRIGKLGSELGQGIRNFKDGLQGKAKSSDSEPEETPDTKK